MLILVLLLIFYSGWYFFQIRTTTDPTQATNIPTTTSTEISIIYQITQALSAKNSWDASELEVTISSIEGEFAKGTVKLTDGMGGGLWFAAQENGVWNIVYDGNGIITCDQLANYQNFPTSLIPSCYDKQTETLIAR